MSFTHFICVCAPQRHKIVTGAVEPIDEECEWRSDREEEEELAVSTCSDLICFSDFLQQ